MPGLVPRNNSPPCPGADGGQLGDALRFNVFCAHNIEGETIETLDADSFSDCVQKCTNHHPRCDAVTFSIRERCRLKVNIIPKETRPSRIVDGAAALYPDLGPSGCSSGGMAVAGANFRTFCGKVSPGNDFANMHQQSMDGCARACAGTNGCVGFTFDSLMSQGFNNCYLKNSVPSGNIIDGPGVDTAVVNNAADTGGGNGGGGGGGGGAGGIVILPSPAVSLSHASKNKTASVRLHFPSPTTASHKHDTNTS
jgi:hypothetical protein